MILPIAWRLMSPIILFSACIWGGWDTVVQGCWAVQIIKLASSFLNSSWAVSVFFTGKDATYLSEVSGKHHTKVLAKGGIFVHFKTAMIFKCLRKSLKDWHRYWKTFANLSDGNGTTENCMVYNRATKIQFMLSSWFCFNFFLNEKLIEFSASLFLF